MSETPKDVFAALLVEWSSPESRDGGGEVWWEQQRAEWLARFDAAEYRVRVGETTRLANAREVAEEARELRDGWISVEERLPEPDADVLLFARSTGRQILRGENAGAPLPDSTSIAVGRLVADDDDPHFYSYDDGFESNFIRLRGEDGEPPNPAVTHWRPLPPPPEAPK